MNTSCPYCNSAVPLPAEPPESRRLICPRCGEAFPMPAEPAPSLNGTPVAVAGTAVVPSSVNRRSRNRRLGLAVIGGMLLLAAVVAVALVFTRSKRGLTTLAELPTLGYIPDDSNVIVAMNVATAEDSAEGREMLDRLGFSPGSALDLEKLAGLPREQIEDAVVGLRFDSTHLRIPRIVVAVRTRSAYDADALRHQLGSKGSKQEGARPYDIIQPKGLPQEGALWCPTPRTLVVCFPEKDFDKVPAQAAESVDRFGPDLANLLHSRSERGTFFWLAAHAEDWNRTSARVPLSLFLKMPGEDIDEIFKARTIGLAMRIDTGTITTRVRPARITEETPADARRIALDLVFETAPGTEMPPLVDGLDRWIEKQGLVPQRPERPMGNPQSHSVIISGTPQDWSRALKALRK